uniref:Uncharacterized protein n=1 Tax=Siphoviridae sp. ct2hZ16 TaxID=2826276 RepID=A0A8S5QVC8_9CAUD|nr:MAG TPA: hypothetical protein [Siphoviridae sp. ct2hZ16]
MSNFMSGAEFDMSKHFKVLTSDNQYKAIVEGENNE